MAENAEVVRSSNDAFKLLTTEQLKKKRQVLRRQITCNCNQIEEILNSERPSQRALKTFVTKLLEASKDASTVNDIILEDEDDEIATKEAELQAKYVYRTETVLESAESYLARVQDDGSSVNSNSSRYPRDAALAQVNLVPSQQVHMPVSARNSDTPSNDDHESRQPARDYELRRLDDEIRSIDRQVNRTARNGTLGTAAPPEINEDLRNRNSPFPSNRSPVAPDFRDEAPDDWIDQYYVGRYPHDFGASDLSHRSAVRADLESFDGAAVRWFAWIDLFRSLVHDTHQSPGEKLAILRRNLRGDCLDVVYSLGGGEGAYKEALMRLKANFGRRDVMRAAHLQSIDKLDSGRGNPSAFKRYAERIRGHLFDLNRIGEKTNTDIIERITAKLHVQDRLAWNEGKVNLPQPIDLLRFADWLCSRASAYLNALDLAAEQQKKDLGESLPRNPTRPSQKIRTHQTTASTEQDSSKFKVRCLRCQGEHRLSDCEDFKKLSPDDRLNFVKSSKLCYSCLNGQHLARKCRTGKRCDLNGCNMRHHQLLHKDPQVSAVISSAVSSTSTATVAFGVIQAWVRSPDGRKAKVNVLFDEGSDTTLVREGLLKQLGMNGEVGPFRISGVTGTSSEVHSFAVTLILETMDGSKTRSIKARSVPKVCGPLARVPWSQLKESWGHLKGLPLGTSEGSIDILLGLDNAELMVPLDVRSGREGEPVAMKTQLGWIARGVLTKGIGPSVSQSNFLTSLTCSTSHDHDLTKQFKKFCESESFGIEGPEKKKLAPEDQLALDLVEKGIKRLDVGYEVPLPWCPGEPALPDNRELAEHRLRGLQKRFAKDPDFEADYTRAIQKYLDEGYAHEVIESEDEPARAVYYLPHHGVYKRSAKEKKLRVVFDSAAVFKGKSLNGALLTGPALQNELPLVLVRFREGTVAITGDIEAMFSRIRLKEEDARYHRFLWQPPGSSVVKTLQMDRVTFGDRCSPFLAIYTTRRTARDHGEPNSEAVLAIEKNLYVDDYLDSAKNAEEATRKARGIRDLLANGDFRLTKWMSNSPHVVAALSDVEANEDSPDSPISEGRSFTAEDSRSVLGLHWTPSLDVFSFASEPGEVVFTRRGLLSKMAGIFDPLGFIAPVTVKAKVKLRELGQLGLAWDDPIPENERQWWSLWADQLPNLRSLKIPRCLFPAEEDLECTELHTFCDASQEAFAAAVYLRNVYANGEIKIQLVAAKTKLAPIKAISVAKLELQAAVLGSRLTCYIEKGFTRPIQRRFFWTDSSCVRNWIRSSAAFYKLFVSHRIGELQTLTEATEWRFVPGNQNPSDAATRSVLLSEPFPSPNWLEGPDFLRKSDFEWPNDVPWLPNCEELRPSCQPIPSVLQASAATPVCWDSIKLKTIADLTRLDGEFASLLKKCQEEAFSTDLDSLKKGKPLKKTSNLLSFTPFIDENGFLRVGGRVSRAELPYDAKHPILLPGKHPLTQKILTAFHEILMHAGTDHVLSNVRQLFWILRGREALKQIRRSCITCQRENAKLATQQMAELPRERLAAFKPPFYFTAVDYFGPLEVTYGRGGTAKRYGALFTCLTTRAVYVDLAKTLSSEDFLLVLRRFIAVRGRPKTILSDNGTNFIGAERELRQEAAKLSQQADLNNFCESQTIDWKFQPPNAPHFGGAHESLVKSTKRALYRVLDLERTSHRRPTEECLRTLLFEISSFLNSRPLTYLSSDPDDVRPLTPKDFLNQTPYLCTPAGDFSADLPREQYRYSQRLAQMFWDIWLKYYLPTLVTRKKWHQKKENLEKGDVVLVADPKIPRGRWMVGRVIRTFPGVDTAVRVVEVKTNSGTLVRPIHRLCLLEKNPVEQPNPEKLLGGEDVPAKSLNLTEPI